MMRVQTREVDTQKALIDKLDSKKHDPVELGHWLFESRYWPKQEEIMRSVWANKKTAVKSCNSGGKSRISAEIALLYLLSFRPSRAITTAPTFLQVEQILWKEIHALYHKSRLPFAGQLNKTSLSLGTYGGQPWDMIGISTNEENRMQGFKSPHLLVILDEALGVDPIIWQAIEGLHPHRVLAIGNPLDPSGNFFDCFSSSLWNKITIDGEECVEWQKEHGAIPGLITREWIEERRHEWGPKSSLFQARIKGEFPFEGEGVLIRRDWVDEARNRTIDDDDEETGPRLVACDVATKHGKAETVVGKRYGHTLKEIRGYFQIPTTETADILSWAYADFKPSNIVVDSDGVGEGIADILQSKRIFCSEFHGGYSQKAIDETKFRNLRSQFFWIVAKKFEKGLYSLSQIPEKQYEILKNQLCSIKVKAPDARGRIQIETKDDMAARGIKSPDYADDFMMLEYAFWSCKMIEIQPFAYR